MSFTYQDGQLCAEAVPLSAIADRYGTPCYVYSRAQLEASWRAYDQAFGTRRHDIHYAVKANGNLALLNLLVRLGSGFDIVSGGELERALAAGARPERIVFSGVGKSRAELDRALQAGVGCINVESLPELQRLNEAAAALGRRAPLAIRVNPDVDPKTHPYISTGLNQNKFGIPMQDAVAVYEQALRLPHLEIRGVACHIGSQLTSLAPFTDAIARVMVLVGLLQASGIPVAHVDAGGGLGITYRDEAPPSIAALVATLCAAVPEVYEIRIEPGRSIVGNAGVLVTTVEYLKTMPAKDFAVCDAAMTELIRPALYEAWHEVLPVTQVPAGADMRCFDLVGPVCETADFLATGRRLALAEGTRLALMGTGAYGFVMASNYNARPRPPEVLVDGHRMHLVRARETVTALMGGERMLP